MNPFLAALIFFLLAIIAAMFKGCDKAKEEKK